MSFLLGKHRLNLVVACSSIACLCGCGEARTDVGMVTGTVTLNGEPLKDAQIEFAPASGKTSYGKTDDSGTYTMMTSRGVKGSALGKHQVRITTADVIEKDGQEVLVPEKLPAKYNTETELFADIKVGDNVVVFELVHTGADIDQPELVHQ